MRTKILFLALIVSSAPASAGAERSSFPVRNAEDLLSSSDGHWVFASGMTGGGQTSGGLAAIEMRTGAVRHLDPVADTVPSSGSKTCTQPVAASDFKPHGITLHRTASGPEQLFVVNHGGRESIEIYRVEGGNRPELRWTGCIPLPPGPFGNSVTVSPDGTIYMTNMGKSLDGTHTGGDVVSWRADGGWRTVPDSRIRGANGLLSSPDGKRLYVASWWNREIVELTLGAQKSTRRVLPIGFLADNLRWSVSGKILAAGQDSTPKAVEDCFYAPTPNCSVPSALAEIDPATFTVRCTRTIPINTATVALNVKKSVLIGTFRGERVHQIDGGCGATG